MDNNFNNEFNNNGLNGNQINSNEFDSNTNNYNNSAWGKEQKVKDKSSFFAGLVVGLTFTLALMVIVFLGRFLLTKEYIETDDKSQMLDNAGFKPDGSSKEEATSGNKNNNKVDMDEVFSKAGYIQKLIEKYYYYEEDIPNTEEGVYAGMLAALGDPYSVYYDEEAFEAMMESSSGSYCGIGVVVQQKMDTKTITVVNPYKGCPGYEAGIRPGDIILGTSEVDFTGMDINEAVSYIRGEENSKVTVRILRGEEEMAFEVTRKVIDIPTVTYELLENSIAYIKIESFDEVTYGQFDEAMKKAENDNCIGYIFDVRDNGGGLYDTVVDMLDDILPAGKIVFTKDRDGQGDTQLSDDNCLEAPMAVLTNGNSASASEIFAGAIQDYGIGKVIGTQSFGKGIVQSVIPIGDGTAIKLTVSAYFTPNGRNIHGEGITPDIVVELPEGEEAYENGYVKREYDTQLKEAIKYILEQK